MPSAKKVALVTGAGRGIGLGIAQCLAKDGCDIVVCGVREAAAVADVLDGLRQLAEVLYCRADVSDATARAEMIGEIRQRFGRLNVLVNNAGVAPRVRVDTSKRPRRASSG